MNSAPAELLQLLTIAALQPSSSIDRDRRGNDGSVGTGTLLNFVSMRRREKKKPPCLNTIRQCGLFFSRSFRAY
jgi:hypothetical protein